MSNLSFPLPNKTSLAVGAVLGQAGCANTGLVLQKYVVADTGNKQWKKEFLDSIVCKKNSDVDQLFPLVFSRWKAMLDGFNGTSWQVKQFTARTRWRLVAGLGIASTLEASMSMHPVYGFPYIPGSSLKGMARACAESLVKKGDEKAQTAINDIFGPDPEDDKKEEARRGKVIFFDAMPEKLPELDVDIINSHYSDYYEGKAPPADWLSPIPVYFLAVRPKTPFRFAVASKDETLAGQADAWLREGLDKLGVGSKTMVGYGHFDVPKDKQA